MLIIDFLCMFSMFGLLLMGLYLNSFWHPISAISLLKSSHNICLWFGCESICILIVCCMIRISLISSMCEGMYKCNMSHDCNGWFFI